MRRAVIFVVSVLMFGVGVCGAQESDDGGTMDWVLVPVGTDGKHSVSRSKGPDCGDPGPGPTVATSRRRADPPPRGSRSVGASRSGRWARRRPASRRIWSGGYRIETRASRRRMNAGRRLAEATRSANRRGARPG